VHWSRRLIARNDVTVILVPVSIRFRTSLAAVFFPILAARLAELHGERISARNGISAEVWRGVLSSLNPDLESDRDSVAHLMDVLFAEVDESDLRRFADSARSAQRYCATPHGDGGLQRRGAPGRF
jgi:hypothetical protein